MVVDLYSMQSMTSDRRLLTSVYEAVQIHSILYCRERGKDLTPLWFLYLMSVVQFLQVRTIHWDYNQFLQVRTIHWDSNQFLQVRTIHWDSNLFLQVITITGTLISSYR